MCQSLNFTGDKNGTSAFLSTVVDVGSGRS